jgi:hypothetical protein
MSRVIDISGLDKKMQEAINQVLHPRVVDISNLDKGLVHQIEDGLETDMKMPPDDAVRVVRRYFDEKRKRRN